MKKNYFLAFLLLSLAWVGCKQKDLSYDTNAILQPVGESLILPLHENFRIKCDSLLVSAQNFALLRDSSSLDLLQSRLIEAELAWQACELFNFGPIADHYYHNRIGTWPCDSNGIDASLVGSDSLSLSWISGKGSDERGLFALEYLLFALPQDSLLPSFFSPNERKLNYLLAAGEDLTLRAAELEAEWFPMGGDYARIWYESQENGIDHPVSLLVNACIALLDDVARRKLGIPMGKFDLGFIQPQEAQAWRSQMSLALVVENLEILHQVFRGPDDLGGLDEALNALEVSRDKEPLSEVIDQALVKCKADLALVPTPFFQALTDQDPALEQVYQDVKELLTLFKADLASGLSITVTVSDNDGD